MAVCRRISKESVLNIRPLTCKIYHTIAEVTINKTLNVTMQYIRDLAF